MYFDAHEKNKDFFGLEENHEENRPDQERMV
jgi:hypothetical protein